MAVDGVVRANDTSRVPLVGQRPDGVVMGVENPVVAREHLVGAFVHLRHSLHDVEVLLDDSVQRLEALKGVFDAAKDSEKLFSRPLVRCASAMCSLGIGLVISGASDRGEYRGRCLIRLGDRLSKIGFAFIKSRPDRLDDVADAAHDSATSQFPSYPRVNGHLEGGR